MIISYLICFFTLMMVTCELKVKANNQKTYMKLLDIYMLTPLFFCVVCVTFLQNTDTMILDKGE